MREREKGGRERGGRKKVREKSVNGKENMKGEGVREGVLLCLVCFWTSPF